MYLIKNMRENVFPPLLTSESFRVKSKVTGNLLTGMSSKAMHNYYIHCSCDHCWGRERGEGGRVLVGVGREQEQGKEKRIIIKLVRENRVER